MTTPAGPPQAPFQWPRPTPHQLHSLARAWLDEDAPTPDPAAWTLGFSPLRAQLLSKSQGVLAGSPFVEAVCHESGCQIDWLVAEGSHLPPGKSLVAKVTGPAVGLLGAERVVLNILGRCSGVATAASEALQVAQRLRWKGVVAGTRKTTPGFRLAEKYSLAVGGAQPHRDVLGALVMLKDNHLAAHPGGLQQLVAEGRRVAGFSRKVAVEASSLPQALAAASAGADIVLLDNFAPEELQQVARRVKVAHPGVILEASGGVTPALLPLILTPDLDVVSMGCLTHSAPSLDFALRVLPPDPPSHP